MEHVEDNGQAAMQCHLPSSTAIHVHVVALMLLLLLLLLFLLYQKTHVVAQNFPIILYKLCSCFGYNSCTIFFLSTQALYIHPDEPYSLHWPMRGGHLNLHDGPGGSLTAVCADLETLWAYAIQTHLAIPLRDLGVCFPF